MQCKHEADELGQTCKKGHAFCMEEQCPDYEPVEDGREEA